MDTLPLILVIGVVGCSASTEEMIAEAKECVAHAPGIVGQATEEQREACWAAVNKRIEMKAKKAEKERSGRCAPGYTKWCVNHNCGCITDSEMREALRGLGY